MLQSHYADLSSAVNDDNLYAFGTDLVECKFAEQSKVNNKNTTELLEIVDSQFNKTSMRGQSARAFFNDFVLILANKLKRNDIAQSLVTTYSKSY